MGLHQIIYTSCMRGIQGVNDGQQVYSYDAGFQDAGSDGVKSLFSYQLPALPPGVVMTEELAPAMPRSFTYRKLPGGGCALALSTYLGRDYMGSDGRFGNHLSHVVTADHPAELGGYPCEFFGSPMLRDHMEYGEVNNPERPDFLPEPVAEKGGVVDLDGVTEFLAEGERMDLFQDMLWAALSFDTARRRLVICDEPENIIRWIAAIEYVLPLEAAMDINFTTYDFDPALSSSRICGVRPEGTKYRPDARSQHFVFDFFDGTFARFDDKDQEFCQFVDTALSFSYESLQDFHRFLEEGYTYRGADLRLCAAYRLYSLLSDGLAGMDAAGLSEALAFGQEFALPGERARIADSLLEQSQQLLGAEEAVFLCGVGFLADQLDSLAEDRREQIRALAVDRVLDGFVQSPGEEAFGRLYGQVEALCGRAGFSLSGALMAPAGRDKLLAAMERDPELWKIGFIVGLAAAYAKERRLPVSQLMPEAPLGQTLCGLVRTVYGAGGQNGFYLVTRILEAFDWDGDYLANMALNLEGVLLDLPGGGDEAQRLWRHFTGLLEQSGQGEGACRVLADCGRFDQVYALCAQAMTRASGVEGARRVYKDYGELFRSDPQGSREYGPRLAQAYYRRLSAFGGESALAAKADLLCGLLPRRQEFSFLPALTEEVAEGLPLEKPSPQQERWIKEIYGAYSRDKRVSAMPERLRLLCVGMVAEQCHSPAELEQSLGSMEEQGLTVRASGSRPEEYDAYAQWVLGAAAPLCRTRPRMAALARVLCFTGGAGAALYREWTRLWVKESKGDKDCRLLVDLLSVLFQYAGSDALVRQEVGKVLGRLNKQRSAELDAAMVRAFRANPEALALWDELRAAAAAGPGSLREGLSSGLNNLTSLFKRRQ